jgi:hypothetical protein
VTGEFSRQRLPGFDLTIVVPFGFGWWEVAERAVEPVVVEPVHRVQGGEFDVVDLAPRPFGADALELVEPDQGLDLGTLL